MKAITSTFIIFFISAEQLFFSTTVSNNLPSPSYLKFSTFLLISNNLDYIVDETCSRLRESYTTFNTTSSRNLGPRSTRNHLVVDFVFSTLGNRDICVSTDSTVSIFTDFEILKGKIFFRFHEVHKIVAIFFSILHIRIFIFNLY